MRLGWITTSVLMSSSILSTSIDTRFSSKSRRSSLTKICGSEAPAPMPIIGFIGMPNTGSPAITPTSGFVVVVTRAIARATSYSSSRSRSGESTGSASFWSAKLTARPR